MITVQLTGGLGNQLFQFFFGTYMADKCKDRLQLKVDERFKINLPNMDIFMNTDFVDCHVEPNVYWRIYRKVERFSKIQLTPLLRLSDYYNSDVTGFDPKIFLLRGNVFFSGYFQTYKFLESPFQSSLVSKLRCYSGSDEFLKKCKSLTAEKPVIVHIRRGDYRGHSKSIGLLSNDYYIKAIRHARELVGDRKIYFMSDDNEFSAKLMKSIGVSQAEPLEIQNGVSAHETMFLGQLACVNILANSTFAWWSAYLNSDSVKIAPTKWFRSLKDPVALIPDHWHRIESSWDE